MGTVVLVCGLPGAGKTTLARRLADERDAVLLCPDDWLLALDLDPHDARLRKALERRQWSHALDLVARGLDVVLELRGWSRVERRWLREQARGSGATLELVLFDVPLEERWRRVERRNAEPGAVVITREQLESFERWWQPDAPDDAQRRSGAASSAPKPAP